MINNIYVRPLSQKWFPEATPQNYETWSETSIGSGTNGTINITAGATDGLSIAVAIAAGAGADLAASFANKTITVTLGTGAEAGKADDTKNTAKLIAAAINAVEDKTWTAKESGTGATAISAAVTKKAFTVDETEGTPCIDISAALYDGTTGTYYVCTTADTSKYNAGWNSFTLTAL